MYFQLYNVLAYNYSIMILIIGNFLNGDVSVYDLSLIEFNLCFPLVASV